MQPDFFDNRARIVKDDLVANIAAGDRVAIAASVFSMYAYQELASQLDGIDELRFVFTSQAFTKQRPAREKREFYIPRLSREQGLCGTDFEIKLRNELTQKAVATECADWIRRKARFRSFEGEGRMSGFMDIDKTDDNVAYMPFDGFTTRKLGCDSSTEAPDVTMRLDSSQSRALLKQFDDAWDSGELHDVTDAVIDGITAMYQENAPELIYYMALYRIFSEFLDDVSEDVLPNEELGFRESLIWNKLYDFQKDAALAIINKLETYNGCILADSVGLGKTFTALAVIKYYESRNRDVLVLCPKKLRDNWITYNSNVVNNPIAGDRLQYDVLYHTDPSYAQYLGRFEAHSVHSGYFSVDKKGNAVESKAEKKAEREDGIGINDDDAKRAYDLILRDKERLLSFDEPVRFIFSHSALREGWDNPNIFQICTLKESGSETSKRQEVGRGMRLAVDQDGNRQDAILLGPDEVHRVNLLTVIASESYETFVRDLQTDISKSLRERPKKVEMDLFSGRDVVLDGETVSFTEDESRRVYKALYKCDLIDDDDKPTAEFRKAVEDGTFVEYFIAKLPEEIADAAHAKAVEALVRSVYDAHALDDMIGRAQEKVSENTLTDNFAKREFKELWARINRKHAYTVSFSDDELRRKSIERINCDLRVSRLQYALTVGGQKAWATRDEVQGGSSFGRTQTETRDVDAGTASVGVTYDLVGEVAQAAAITRRSAAAILAGIDANVFGLYRVNPEEFIKKAAALIVSEKATMVVEHISYHEIDDVYDEAIFTERMPDNASKAYEAKKNIQRFVFPDSDGERRFAEDMDAAAEVAVYAKLPRTFQIPTPVGNYAPDWAIAFKEGSVRHVFFVAETKGTMDTLELSGVENAKIARAKKLFNEMSTGDVRYHNVATYEDLLEVMGRMS